MITDTDICNLALSRIAVTSYISSLDEPSGKEARTCRLLYPMARDRVLESFNWPFARTQADLQDIGDPPDSWGYRYRVPIDCIRARQVVSESSRNPSLEAAIPFITVEDEENGTTAILTDVSPAQLIYTKRITSTALYTPLFINAFSWLLASELVLPFAKDAKLITYCINAYNEAVRQAAAASLNSQRQDLKPTDSYITSRQ